MRPDPDRIYLNVPFSEKEDVKRLGAKWDAQSKGWWIPISPVDERFFDWVPKLYRQSSPVLQASLIPQPCWGLNLHRLLTAEEWREIRRSVYDRAGNRCEICGGRGDRWPVECDEEWEYIEDLASPGDACLRLVDLRALCPSCHAAKHLGKAQVQGRYDEALDQLAYVNGWTEEQCDIHASQAFMEFERRSLLKWTIDFSFVRCLNVSKIYLDAYDFEALPEIEGIDVCLYPTFTMIFNRTALMAHDYHR